MVVTEYLLDNVLIKMKWLDRNVGAFKTAFQERPEVFDAVCMNLPVHISDSMVDNAVGVSAPRFVIGDRAVCVDGRAEADIAEHILLQGFALDVGTTDARICLVSRSRIP